MGGCTIEVSRIPLIPNEQVLVEFLEETVGNGHVRACKLVKQSSFNSEAEASALVEIDSEESALALHNLAKAGILVFWCATLAVEFVHKDKDRDAVSQPNEPNPVAPKGLSDHHTNVSLYDPKNSLPQLVSDQNISVPQVVRETNIFVPKALSDPNISSQAKVYVPKAYEPKTVAEPNFFVSHVLPEPKDFVPKHFVTKVLSEPKDSVSKFFVPHVLSEPKDSVPKLFVPQALSEPKHFVPQVLSEPKVSVPKLVSELKAFGPQDVTASNISAPKPKFVSEQNVSVSKSSSGAKAGKGLKNVATAKSSETYWEGLTLHIGCQISENSFYVLCSLKGAIAEFEFEHKRINLFVRESLIEYKIKLAFVDIHYIHRRQCQATNNSVRLLLLRLRHSPRIYMCSGSHCDKKGYNYKGSKDAQWIRTTDFTEYCSIGQSSSFCLELPNFVDISHIQNHFAHYKEIDVNFFLEHGSPSSSTSNLVPIINPPEGFILPYKMMFQINSLVQRSILSWPTLGKEFFNLLRPERIPVAYINHALTKLGKSGWKTCYRPVDWLTEELSMLEKANRHLHSEEVSLDNDLMQVNRVEVTPSKVYFRGPEVNVSNRVIRHFANYIDNFLRVSFVDENLNTLSSRDLSQWTSREAPKKHTKIYERILSVLKEGIVIGDKKFEFLAFSSSQLRESSLWMFASTNTVNADAIRKWLGYFPAIKNVAKCAARMGQAFSSSTATVDVPLDEFEYISDIDIDSNGRRYIFSDGIGKISPSFAEQVARMCGFDKKTPSAFQIRYAGYKGVVAVDPTSTRKLTLRPSMRKYTSNNRSLDVLSWTKYVPCFLNRQIITLLSTLGVKDENFERLQSQAVAHLDQLLTSRDKALAVLQIHFSGDNHRLLTDMLSCGYCPSSEPYLSMMLQAFRASKIQDLKTKARIFVPKGRCLMGCLDETRTLNYGEVFIQISPAPGNKEFHDAGNNATSIVEGKIIVAKNPCLHPGDIRILVAKNIPKLHHMVDCIVFPQKGKRPHPSECSGSDLDGDLYFTSWDELLIPSQQDLPMDYVAKAPKQLDRNVTIEDMQEHFVNHMVNDTLGKIANSHLVFSDQKQDMARSPECLKLAELHSTAVDFAKTGVAAEIPPELHPKRYPDFMEKEDMETYKSTRILGKLYRSLQEAAPQNLFTISSLAGKAYDKDLEVMGYDRYLDEAFIYKTRYDSRLAIMMDYYGIKTEAEIISGNINSLSNFVGNNKRHGNVRETIMSAVKSLKNEARRWFELEDRYSDVCEGTKKSFHKKFAKASAWYYVTYHPSYYGKGASHDNIKTAHLISFPWVLSDVLLHIKQTKK